MREELKHVIKEVRRNEAVIEYLYLKDAFELLPRISFSPSDKTLKAILDYSRTSNLNPSY